MGHAHCKALAETAVLTFVAVLFLDLAVAFALAVLQFESNGSPEEPLWKIHEKTHVMKVDMIKKKTISAGFMKGNLRHFKDQVKIFFLTEYIVNAL